MWADRWIGSPYHRSPGRVHLKTYTVIACAQKTKKNKQYPGETEKQTADMKVIVQHDIPVCAAKRTQALQRLTRKRPTIASGILLAPTALTSGIVPNISE